MVKYKDYSIKVFNIEREVEKPRKDYTSYKSIRNFVFYMYDELFKNPTYDTPKITDKKEIETILNTYYDEYLELNDKDLWFSKIKEMCDKLGYASNIKDYKKNPTNYKGNVSDVTGLIRVSLTSKMNTPDLFYIMELLGKDKIKERFTKYINTIK